MELTITEIINVQHNVIGVIEESQLRYFGHLKGMGSDKIPKMTLDWNAESKRRGVKP